EPRGAGAADPRRRARGVRRARLPRRVDGGRRRARRHHQARALHALRLQGRAAAGVHRAGARRAAGGHLGGRRGRVGSGGDAAQRHPRVLPLPRGAGPDVDRAVLGVERGRGGAGGGPRPAERLHRLPARRAGAGHRPAAAGRVGAGDRRGVRAAGELAGHRAVGDRRAGHRLPHGPGLDGARGGAARARRDGL
ncbi:MAG: Transcriptional regulator, AcrR family, partial [uncultured Pseudonocardia sp.]